MTSIFKAASSHKDTKQVSEKQLRQKRLVFKQIQPFVLRTFVE